MSTALLVLNLFVLSFPAQAGTESQWRVCIQYLNSALTLAGRPNLLFAQISQTLEVVLRRSSLNEAVPFRKDLRAVAPQLGPVGVRSILRAQNLSSFSHITYAQIPSYEVGPRAANILDHTSIEIWEKAAFTLQYISRGEAHARLDRAHDESVAAVGPVELTNVIPLYPDPAGKPSPFDWRYSPAVIGSLKSGQPVLVFLLASEESTVTSLPLVNRGQQSFVNSFLNASFLGHAGRFYGIQRLTRSGTQGVYGMINPLMVDTTSSGYTYLPLRPGRGLTRTLRGASSSRFARRT